MSFRANGWHRVSLGECSAFTDTNSYLNGSITDSGAAIVIPLLGSKIITLYSTLPHPSNGVWATFPIRDGIGNLINNSEYGVLFRVRFGSALTVNDNVQVQFGLVNENTLTGATVDGLTDAIDLTAGSGNGRTRSWILQNGVVGNQLNGVAASGVVGARSMHSRIRGSAQINHGPVVGIDSSGNAIGSIATPTTASVSDGVAGQKYGFVSIARTLVADVDDITVPLILEYIATSQHT